MLDGTGHLRRNLNFTENQRNGTITEEQADVAQLVEQLIRNQQVIGSSPIVGSSLFLPVRSRQKLGFPQATPSQEQTYQIRYQLSTHFLLSA
jgi:hypothetical protein